MISKRTETVERPSRTSAWLGVGALAIGMGAALASGAAVASADAGPSDSSSSAAGAGQARGADVGAKVRARTSTRTTAAGALSGPPRSTLNGAVSSAPTEPAVVADGIDAEEPALASGKVSGRSRLSAPGGAVAARVPISATTDPHEGELPSAAAASALPKPAAAVVELADLAEVAADEDDDWGEKSYLPENQVIVPGASVRLALEQISDAQEILRSQTWGAGNIFAGMASIAPQLFLMQASDRLTGWQDSIEQAKASVADTADKPLAHSFAQLSLLATLMLPTAAGIALDRASALTPLVGLFGAPEAAAEAGELIGDAQQNGMVYAVRLMRTVEKTQQIVYLSVNGGPIVPVQVDTGSSGLSILNRYVGQQNLGEPTGKGSSGYGDDTTSVSYNYTTYLTTLDFGRGAVTAPGNVMIVDADSENVYDNYGTAGTGIAGTLGIGANPGSGTTLNALLPGELKDGILLYQNIIGPWGVVVFGPNPLPSLGSVAGAPIGDIRVQINDGTPQLLKTNVDSGGVDGGLPASVAGSAKQGDKLAPGTVITVYTADGKTQLYSYAVTDKNSPTIYDDSTASTSRPNTGNVPFGLAPIYLDYSPPGGLGATYWDFF